MMDILASDLNNEDCRSFTVTDLADTEEAVNKEGKVVMKIKLKDEEKPFGCSECHKRFTRKGDMYRHLRTHTGEKPFGCPECGDTFCRKDDMVRHLRTHMGVKPFDCTHCDRKFSRRADMYKHMVTHAGAKQTVCSTYSSPEDEDHDLEDSDKIDKNQKPKTRRKRSKDGKDIVFHKCNLCTRAFSRKRDMTRHLRTHNLVDIVNISFNDGNTVVTNKENEEQHENIQVPVLDSSFLEQACGDMVQVEDPTTGQITECRVLLISNAMEGDGDQGTIQIITADQAVQNALLGINNEKPFNCPECGDKFSRKSDMIRHLRIHSGHKPFHCNLCARPFSRRGDMNRHVLTHSGVKPYSCSICTKSFARKSDYEMHYTIHSMDVCPSECQSTDTTNVSSD